MGFSDPKHPSFIYYLSDLKLLSDSTSFQFLEIKQKSEATYKYECREGTVLIRSNDMFVSVRAKNLKWIAKKIESRDDYIVFHEVLYYELLIDLKTVLVSDI